MSVQRVSFMAFALWLVIASAPGASAQDMGPGTAPIDASVAPATIIPGLAVTVSGTSMAIGTNPTVRVTVKPPSGAAQELSAPLDGNGAYRVTFSETRLMGTYDVTATAPDGKGKAQATFVVLAGGGVSSAAASEGQTFARSVGEAAKVVRTLLEQAEPSPPRDDLLKIATEWDGDLEALPKAAQAVGDALAQIDAIVAAYPDAAPAFQGLYAEAANLASQAKTWTQDLQRTSTQVSQMKSVCDAIDMAGQMLATMDIYLGMKTSIVDRMLGFLLDETLADTAVKQIMDRASVQMSASGGRIKLELTGKIGDAVKLLEKPAALGEASVSMAINKAKSAVTKAVREVPSRLFSAYCEQFTGPFTATYTQDLVYRGRKFWSYQIDLEGTLNVRYRRGAATSTPQVTGEFEGNAVRFTLKEDIAGIDARFGKAMRIISRVALPAKGVPYVRSAARGFRAIATPRSFLVPVSGFIDGQMMKLRVEAPRADYDAMGYVFYLVVAPAGGVPMPWSAKLKYRDAAFILDRGLRGAPQLAVTSDRQVSRVKDTFTRQDQGERFRVTFKVDVEACNPSCP